MLQQLSDCRWSAAPQQNWSGSQVLLFLCHLAWRPLPWLPLPGPSWMPAAMTSINSFRMRSATNSASSRARSSRRCFPKRLASASAAKNCFKLMFLSSEGLLG